MVYLRRHRSLISSLLTTAAFFALYLAVFQPGYMVNDDITMISLASGYLGGKALPFLVFSNVILGFLLNGLYGIHSSLNWETWLFLAIYFLSVWALIYQATARAAHPAYRIASALAVLAAAGYALSNITFTLIATFAGLAGICVLLGTARAPVANRRAAWLPGSLLVLAGSLIRLDSVLLVLLVVLPAGLMLHWMFQRKTLLIRLGATGLMVAGCYAFDRIYVSMHPAWDRYYAFNTARGMIQDTPASQKENIGGVLREVGWSRNDYWLFRNWLLLDPQVYTLPKLQYLAAHAHHTVSSLPDALRDYYVTYHIFNDSSTLTYALLMGGTWLLAAVQRPTRRVLPALAVLYATALALVLYLVWAQRVPLHVWYSFLATVTILGICIVSWSSEAEDVAGQPQKGNRLAVGASILFALTTVVSLAMVLWTARDATQANQLRDASYHRMLGELDTLQAGGKLAPNALILSPINGLPIEWANPLFLELPRVHYFQMEWLTFSPAFDAMLREAGAQSLPTGLYEKDNVYLMASPTVMQAALEFLGDHQGVDVQAVPIAVLGDEEALGRGLTLYKLAPK